VINIMCQAIAEGLNERKAEKDKDSAASEKEEAHEGARKRKFSAIDYEAEQPVIKVEGVEEAAESVAEEAETETETTGEEE
jgi:small subunit ribosomal protein S2